MIEKCNPSHPDKVADRIAGAIVDLAYSKEKNPKVAVEVLIGHNECNIITESSVDFDYGEICAIVHRIAGYVIYKTNILQITKHKKLDVEIMVFLKVCH